MEWNRLESIRMDWFGMGWIRNLEWNIMKWKEINWNGTGLK